MLDLALTWVHLPVRLIFRGEQAVKVCEQDAGRIELRAAWQI